MIPFVLWIAMSAALLLFVASGFRSLVRQMADGLMLDDLFMISLFELAFGVGLWVMAGLAHEIVGVGANVMSVFVGVAGVMVVFSHVRPFMRRVRRDGWGSGGVVE
jgi:hypothetical protein